MQIHESFKTDMPFKVDKPFVMPFEHEQNFTPSYMEPAHIVRDSTSLPKKNFFRQLIDLPKEIQALRLAQRTANEDIKDVERLVFKADSRIDETERKLSSVQEQLESLSKRSSMYQDRVENLSSSVNPLVGQIAELKMQSSQINELKTTLNKTKLIVGILFAANIVLLAVIIWPMLNKFM